MRDAFFDHGPPGIDRPLSPPATAAELEWWNAERRRTLVRHQLLRVAIPVFGLPILVAALANPGKFLKPSVFILLGVATALSLGATWISTRFAEPAQRNQAIRWKRIRDSLAAEKDEAHPTE